MSNKVYVVTVQPDPEGPTFGRVMQSADFMKSQLFAHGHIEQIVKDLLVAGAPGAQVAGFAAAVTTALHVSVAKGSIVDANGISYDTESDAATVVTMAAAHLTLPRIDLIYATLEADAETDTEFRPFRRLRTDAELSATPPINPYPPVQENVPTELHTRVTIGVKTGVPNASPAAPAVGAGEVALWRVHVAANQVTLVGGDLTDVRVLMESLYQLSQRVSQSGLTEIVEDVVGGFLGGSTSIVVTYDDAGNAESIALHTTYKSLLDNATATDTVSTLMKRDSSGNVTLNEAKLEAGARFTADSSLIRSAFVREDFISLIDSDAPVQFHAAATGVYETVKRQSAASVPNTSTAVVSVNVQPEFDCYLDPADFESVLFKLEAYALHTAPQPPADAANLQDSDIQIWNATDSTQLTFLNLTWGDILGHKRSGAFSISGTGIKRLVVRARNNFTNVNALLMLWRVRIIINPSF